MLWFIAAFIGWPPREKEQRLDAPFIGFPPPYADSR
jgi:hypothetical protein